MQRTVIVGVVLTALLGGIALAALLFAGGDLEAAYEDCRRQTQPTFTAMQDLGSHLDIGVTQGDYTNQVGDVNATYDQLVAANPDVPCRPVIRALGEALDSYAQASSDWNDCIVEAEEFCGEGGTQELWLKADVAMAEAKGLLNSLAGGQGAVAAAAAKEAQEAADSLAQEQLLTAQIVMETYAIENGGSYANASVFALQEISPNVPDDLIVESTADTYRVSISSESGSWFAVANDAGSLSYPCGRSGEGKCPASGEWE